MDMQKVALRPATQADSRFAFDVKKAALGEYVRETYGWDEDEQRRLHEQRLRPSATRIIVSDGQDVGLVAVREAGDRVHVLQLFLLPEAQGKGIGSHVLAEVLAEAHRLQRRVALRVLKSNPRAKAFYERHRFAVVQQTKTHYMMEEVP
jgi:ribosomal protein S18 acetylase RimI-like enzyme